MQKHGKQTWVFSTPPNLIDGAAVAGPDEGKGPLAADFDLLYADLWAGEKSFELAEKKMMQDACDTVLKRNQDKEVDFFIAGDLLDQIISSSFTARELQIPYLGIFGACSTSMLGLALAGFLVDSGAAKYALAATSSHNNTAEKQFRYPNEYGAQKPPESQYTVSAAGAGLVAATGNGPRITKVTMGKVIDMGISDPNNMGAAMAPAAADTIYQHFQDLQITPDEYDLIITGDLGQVGHAITKELLEQKGIVLNDSQFVDCGLLIYDRENQPVFSGGSGCGCCASVLYGHFRKRLLQGELKKIFVVATGALMSPLSYQQKETIPAIAHGVVLEGK